ncbi:hypothetical protein OKW21_003833 [Catalinimonas alkaloidigena]|uniref:FG-GAP repeat domain-containing protein n=1 Tax=Catalinimonas alkaloidigena TaxID=1075417 RepID=UPI002406EFF9|nr:VCBS repeat-containing protein [Catalinimonas alkaloidigena]MDF9798570.1 hypothetical protein [Catalinimonas alkaloidigena]
MRTQQPIYTLSYFVQVSLTFLLLLFTSGVSSSCESPASTTQSTNEQIEQASDEIETEHIIIGHLGAQHLANLVYRKGADGDKLVGWGRTPITEWPMGSASKQVVVQENPEHRYSNGGCAMDLDGDGVDEIVVARGHISNLKNAKLMWFDEVEGKQHWQGYEIASLWEQGFSAPHDIEPYIFENAEGEQTKAVIANKSRREMYMFVVPEDPAQAWNTYHIGSFPHRNQSGIEIIDINDDGRPDIVSGMFWIEAPENPAQDNWEFHQFGNWENDDWQWAGMNKHGVADFDGDGRLEIVVSEAEIPDARLSLFDPETGKLESTWSQHPIDSGLDAPHSLVVLDLNGDEKPDFLVGEMTAGGWDFPYNPNPKIYAYINQGNMQFDKTVFSEGWGVHEMRILPKKLEGKTVIYAADEIQPQKFNAMNTHVSYWMIASP